MNPVNPSDPHADDLHLLAGEYVLGVLDAAAIHEVAQRLPHDPGLRAAVADWEDKLLPLAALAEPQEPAPGAWNRIEQALPPVRRAAASRRPAAPIDPPRAGWWASLPLWRGLATAGLAAVLALGVLLTQLGAPSSDRYLVVLATPQGSRPGWIVQGTPQGALRLTPLAATRDLPAQKSLQFWTKADGWNAPVPLGLVQPGQPLTVPAGQLPPLQPNQLFEITLEPENGSPTGRPTGPILFIGRAVKLS